MFQTIYLIIYQSLKLYKQHVFLSNLQVVSHFYISLQFYPIKLKVVILNSNFSHIDYIISIMIGKILLLAVLLGLATANQHLNVKYRGILEGNKPLTQRIAQEIYSEYQSTNYQKSMYRFNVFYQNLKEIKQHNSEEHTWRQGINDFTDMTFKQFVNQKLMAPQNCSATSFLKIKPEIKNAPIPESYQWNDYGMVSPVKNQGNCGSCWTFSTVGAMESHWNILGKGKNLTFSQQQLVDCAGAFDNHGCNGGLPSHAFQYIRYTGGLQSQASYPYVAKTNKCVHKPSLDVAYCKHGSYNITLGDEKQLAERLYNVGPISVSFKVITGFQNYAGGVYSHKNCGSTTKDVNHAVLATGFGVEKNVDFWNVKNSWGAGWGVKGYFKIQRGVNMCAIAQCNSYPLIDTPADFIMRGQQNE